MRWNSFQRDAKQATFNAFAIVGIIMSAISVFNWITSRFNIPLSTIFDDIARSYRMATYPITSFILSWAPFHIPTYIHDVIVLWLAIGSAVTATTLSLLSHISKADNLYYATNEEELSRIDDELREPMLRPIWILLSLSLWPIFLAYFFLKPMVVESKHKKQFFLFSLKDYKDLDRKYSRYSKLKANLRQVFCIRVIASVLFLLTGTLLNAAILAS